MDCWELMRDGQRSSAIEVMMQEYLEKDLPTNAIQLGVGLLWLGQYDDAAMHFHQYNERYPGQLAHTYNLAGAARWCQLDLAEAVETWQAGMDCQYADSAGGVESALLLLFAETSRPSLFNNQTSMSIIEARLEDPRSRRWPGPLAAYAVGRIDRAMVESEAVWRDDYVTRLRGWKIEFWTGVIAARAGRTADFRRQMEFVSALSWRDYDDNRSLFIDKLWGPEYYLARASLEE